MRAVVDTNVWISALLSRSGAPARVAEAVGAKLTPVFCPATLQELRSVTRRERMAKLGITPDIFRPFEARLLEAGEYLPDPEPVTVGRDPADDVILALAVAAQVGYVVSGDLDLLDEPSVRYDLAASGVSVVTVQEFPAILDQGTDPPARGA